MLRSTKVKQVLGALPLAAELDWALRSKGAPVGAYKLEELAEKLPEWVAKAAASPLRSQPGKKILLFATLHYWLSHAALTGLALAGLGHEVHLGYLPYATWKAEINNFDLRRRQLYTRDVLKPAEDLLHPFSLSSGRNGRALPPELEEEVRQVSIRDAQYTLQVEDVDTENELFQLRLRRNHAAGAAAYAWLEAEKPDVVILPNGLIIEFGVVLAAARHLDVPVVSYEFGEQRDRIWLSHNSPVMLQETDAMWAARKGADFDHQQQAEVEELFATRQKAGLFRNFYRRWQDVPAEGGAETRAKLKLDGRPVVLLAANVIGDSLTLGRATFTGDMTTWLKRTVDYFAERDDVQFLLRVHPGEKNLDGPSIADLVADWLPDLPEHLRVIMADDPVNTYDLIAIADLGLVYTTTVGLEMAMSGLPAIVLGKTHYRGKGFTMDPANWDEYFAQLDHHLTDGGKTRLSEEQVETAWHYAYRFFFDYPQPFPWHLLHFWEDVEDFSLAKLFSQEGQELYADTFAHLSGERFDWESVA